MRYANIRYSTLLNEAQYDYLSDECQDISRMKCFKTFIRLTLMEQTTVTKTHFSAVLQPGQFMASKVELSLMWGCNRKTATRIIREFNQMGILRSEPSNRTTIHTLLKAVLKQLKSASRHQQIQVGHLLPIQAT